MKHLMIVCLFVVLAITSAPGASPTNLGEFQDTSFYGSRYHRIYQAPWSSEELVALGTWCFEPCGNGWSKPTALFRLNRNGVLLGTRAYCTPPPDPYTCEVPCELFSYRDTLYATLGDFNSNARKLGLSVVQAVCSERFESLNFWHCRPADSGFDYVMAGTMMPDDSSIVVAGESHPVDSLTNWEIGTSDLLLMKTSCRGVPVWRHKYDFATRDSVCDMMRLTSGDFLVVGGAKDSGFDVPCSLSITLLDMAGGLKWHRTYSASSDSSKVGTGAVQIDDTTAVVLVNTTKYGSGPTGFMAIDLRNGDILWCRNYKPRGVNDLSRLKKWGDHVVIAAGQGGMSAWLVAFDCHQRDTLWTFLGKDSSSTEFRYEDWIVKGDTLVAVGYRLFVGAYYGYGVRLIIPEVGVEERSTLTQTGDCLIVKPSIGNRFQFSARQGEVYNLAGRCVRQVHESLWDGRDDRGFLMPIGVYEIKTPSGSMAKVVLVR
jgi:hypothetical protein